MRRLLFIASTRPPSQDMTFVVFLLIHLTPRYYTYIKGCYNGCWALHGCYRDAEVLQESAETRGQGTRGEEKP